MIENLLEQHGKLVRLHQQLIDRFTEYREDQTTARPSPEKWSPIEIAEHLVIVERVVQKVIVESLAKRRSLSQTTLADTIRAVVITILMRIPIKVKAPAKEILPTGSLNSASLPEHLNATDLKWQEILELFSEADLKLRVFKHPVAGWLNISHTLVFVNAHFERHFRQLPRATTEQ